MTYELHEKCRQILTETHKGKSPRGKPRGKNVLIWITVYLSV